ncbi:MAG: T9SS type A sorting domain-containing protein [Bacteroidia bacterium]|nr:T9SS type A sorting domain-containing protein [Bacteroidia bacterium]
MRLRSLSSLLGILLAQAPSPQGGDGCGYRWYTSQSTVVDSAPTYSWVDPLTLNGGSPNILSGMGDDNFVGPILLPTPFVYYWTSYDKLYVGSNGYITFGRGYLAASSPLLPYFNRFPNVASPNEWIAAYLSDLTFVDGDGQPVPGARLYYGTDAQGRFVITWDSVPYWNGAAPGEWSGRNSFQIILNPADSSITLQYRFIQAGYHSSYANGNFNVVGMENITGQFGLDIAAAWPVPFQEFAIKIYPPRVLSCTVTDAQADWSLNPRSEGIFILRRGNAPPSIQAGILNTGNLVINNQIRSSIRIRRIQTTGADIYRDTVIFLANGNFAPSAALIATYTKPLNTNQPPFTSLRTQSFYAINRVQLIGTPADGNNFNNEIGTEVVFCDSGQVGGQYGRYILRYDDGNWDVQQELGGGFDIAGGMTFVMPQDMVIEAISADMLYEDGSPNNRPVAFWVMAYDPASGAVGAVLDSVALEEADFANGDSLNFYTNQNQTAFFYLRRYVIPLTNPISLQAGQGVAVGFRTLAPSGSTYSNFIVSDGAAPISRRALEGISGIWAPYRDLENEDYAVGLVARLAGTSMALNSTSGQSFDWDVMLYPNPSQGTPILRINLPEGGEVVIRIADAQGRIIWQEARNCPAGISKCVIPSGLSSGVYMLGVTYQGYTKGIRMVLE